MSKQKHTPGKWKVKKWKRNVVDGFAYVITDSRGHGLYESLAYGNNLKAKANARLIAAAPELLEACKIALRGFRGLYDSLEEGETELIFTEKALKDESLWPLSALRNIIAKAEGD